ncbi:MAG: MFS transporter [Bacteroidales bacterium]|nr:MFS transporter [Bacteroidales bacterium]
MNNSVNKTIVIIITCLTSFIIPFMGSSINICLPAIDKEFGMNVVSLSWIATAYLLTSSIFILPFGRIADIYGRKKIYLYGISLFTITSLISGLSVSAAMLITARVIQGIASAMIAGTGMAILSSVFSEGERGKIFGINTATVYIGLASGPFIGGILTGYLGWRSVFLVIIPLCLISVIMILTSFKTEWTEAKSEKFDIKGSVLYSIVLLAIIYGLSLLPRYPGIIILSAGLILFPVFIKWETKSVYPMLNIELFRSNIVFGFSNLAALLNYCGTFAVGFTLSLYLQYVKGLTPHSAGMILVSQPIIMSVCSPLTGWLSDKIEPRILASLGMLLSSISLAAFIFITPETQNIFIISNLIILGLGFSLFSSPNVNAIMGSVEKKYYGVASSTLSTMRSTGQMISMAIAMLVFALFIGKESINPQNIKTFVSSIRVIFIIMTAMSFFGIFASYARGKVNKIK